MDVDATAVSDIIDHGHGHGDYYCVLVMVAAASGSVGGANLSLQQ